MTVITLLYNRKKCYLTYLNYFSSMISTHRIFEKYDCSFQDIDRKHLYYIVRIPP